MSLVAVGMSAAASPLAAQVEVHPDGDSGGTVFTQTTGNQAFFSLIGFGEVWLECDGTLGISCSVDEQSPVDVNFDEGVTVTFSTSSSTGAAEVWLYALDEQEELIDSGYYTYTVSAGIEVSAASVPSTLTQYAQEETATFWVKNTSGTSQSFTLSCRWDVALCAASPSDTTISDGDSITVTATFDAGGTTGSHSLRLDAVGGPYSDYESQSVTVTEFVSVVATAKSPVFVQPSTAVTDSFLVTFPGQANAAWFDLQCSGLSCSPSADSVEVDADGEYVSVDYTSGSNGDTTTITLTVTKSDDPSVSVQADMDVVATSDILLSVDDANPGLEEWGPDCITVRAGPGIIRCDDFLYRYPFTAITRMNRQYQAALTYDSRRRLPIYNLGANFVLPPGTSEPDSLVAVLRSDTLVRNTTTYPASTYGVGERTRIAFAGCMCEFVATDNAVVEYEVSITPYTGGSPGSEVVADGRFLAVERGSYLGRGWWLEGWEHLSVDDTLTWVGGDGSARAYIPLDDSTYVAWSRTRPDTIIEAGSEYHRLLIGGGKVVFDAAGNHVRTESREGSETRFVIDSINGELRLASIDVRPPSGTWETIFEFDYDTTSNVLLSEVRVPAASTGWDTYDVTSQSIAPGVTSLVKSIETPDGRTTDFEYDAAGLVGARLDKITAYPSASDTTVALIEYAVLNPYVVVMASTAADYSVLAYLPSSLRGVATDTSFFGPRPVEEVTSLLDGPLSTNDTTLFYPTGWGGIRGIRDAAHHETWIDYDDPDYPSHPTRVRHPNGWEVTASYYSNGLLEEVTDRSTGAVTSYEWNTTWSRPSKITSAEGVVSELTYNGDGNPTKQIVGPDTVTFAYGNMGTAPQVSAITDAEGNTVSFDYDSYGNLKAESGSLGTWAHYFRDSRGYVDKASAPTGAASDSTVVETTYDVMGRVTETFQWTSQDGMRLRTFTTYDSSSGLVTATAPWSIAHGDSTSTGTSQWEYDGFGRPILIEHPSATDSLVYDVVGNVLERHRGGHMVTMTYDGMGRLIARTIPEKSYADTTAYGKVFPYYAQSGLTIDTVTDSFTYDEMGNLLTANNLYSQITRTYYLNGALRTDQQRLKNYSSSVDTIHVYDLAFDYDLDGRRTAVHHPTFSAGSDRTTYHFDDTTGRLGAITDALGDVWSFTHDANGRPTQVTFPGGYDAMQYDALGRMTDLDVYAGAGWLFQDGRTFDKATRVLTDGSGEWTYDGFGHVLTGEAFDGVANIQEEAFVRDAFGNAVEHHAVSWPVEANPLQPDPPGMLWEHTFGVGGRVGASDQEWPLAQEPEGWNADDVDYAYDASGQLHKLDIEKHWWTFEEQGGNPYAEADLDAKIQEHSISYYAADGKLRVHQSLRDSIVVSTVEGSWGVYEEYWYDALGRRVLKRTQQEAPLCTVGARCESATERFVWDGDQILWELRSTGTPDLAPASSADVNYIHAGGIDAPLGIIRDGTAYVLHRDIRGRVREATTTSGSTTFTDVPWPGEVWSVQETTFEPQDVHDWVGSVPMGQRDASGLIYRRNRYYGSVSGQFTQQDPIGIAGGLNLYGYANGDAVNFSDPFGLGPCEEDEGFWACVGRVVSEFAEAQWEGFTTPLDQGPPEGGSAGWALSRGLLPFAAAGTTSRLATGAVAAEAATTAGMSGMLRSAAAGKGNFGIGSGSAALADDLGRAWVGEGYSVSSSGTWVSANGLRQYRPPSYKPNLGVAQANLEWRLPGLTQWQGNAHLTIIP